VFGHHAEFALPRQGALPAGVPAVIEGSAIRLDVGRRNVMWCVGGAERQVDEEGLVRSHRLLLTDIGDRAIGDVDRQVVVGIVGGRDRHRALEHTRVVLIGLTAEETVEAFETLSGRPAVEWPGRSGFPHRRLMPFAERGGVVSV
jgi:hypothetical protein